MDRIYLKGVSKDDFEDYYTIRCTPSDILWNGYSDKPNFEKLRKVFNSRLHDNPLKKIDSGRIYLIKLKEDDLTVGFIHMLRKQDGIEIGYTILDKYQGFGYATEALLKLSDIAKKESSIVYLKIREDNIASQKVAKKCGFIATDELSIRSAPMGDFVMRKYILK